MGRVGFALFLFLFWLELLGYGATTLPALTEALTIDRNATAAEYEAERLTDLFEALAEKIKV